MRTAFSSTLFLFSQTAVALVAPQAALAQEVPEIVVTARGLPDAPGDRALAITTIETIDPASGRLETALRDVAGLAQFRRSDARSANPTSQGLNLRGLGGNASGRVLVLLDGVPQGDPFAGYVNWPAYLSERIGRVRVTRGGGSGAGGSGALTGTVVLESVGARDVAPIAVSVIGGSFDTLDARALLSGRLGKGFAVLSAGYARSDGFVPIIASQRGVADRAAPYEQASFAARAAVPLGGGEAQTAVLLFTDRRERGTDFSANLTRGADASLRFVARNATLTGYVQLRQFRSQFAAVNSARTLATPTLDQFNTPAIGLGLIGEWRPRVGALDLRLGGEWRRAEGETNERFSFSNGAFTRIRRAGGQSDIWGGYAEGTIEKGALTLTGGARIDHWRLSHGFRDEAPIGVGTAAVAAVFAPRRGWAGTGRIGAALAASEAVTLRSAAYLGWRLPTLNELYRPFRVGIEQTNANAALAPERSRGLEVGLDWQPHSAMRVGATAFIMRLDDAIANITLSASPTAIVRQRANLAGIGSKGIEVDAHWRRRDWQAKLSASFADARILGSGLRPAQVATVQLAGGVTWRWLSVTARYVGPQFEDDLNTRRLGDALTFDAGVRIPIGRGVTFRAQVENLFDARVEAAVSASGVIERATPRLLSIGLSFGDWDS